jgi:hypothetical protein
MKFTLDHTNMIARQLGFKGNLHEFWLGMNVESERGNVNPRTDIKLNNTLTAKNPRVNHILNENILTAKMTMANLNEKSNYYSQLMKKVEK